MDSKRLLTPFLIALAVLVPPIHVHAATYKLPVRTATLAVEADHYQEFVNGVPVGFYNLELDPPALRFGADAASRLVYESAIIFDWQGISGVAEGDIVSAVLHWTPISVPTDASAYSAIWEGIVQHRAPEVSDFQWQGGGYVGVVFFDPNVPEYDVSYSVWTHGSGGWILTTLGCGTVPVEVADPYVLVTTVAEPSSATCLAGAVSMLAGLFVRSRGRRGAWPAILFSASVALLTGIACADYEEEVGSEPGEAAQRLLVAMPAPPNAALPAEFKVLPAFPRLFWSYGCVPTSGAMLVGYYDNAGFPRMFCNPDGSDALCPTGHYPNDNGAFLKAGDP